MRCAGRVSASPPKRSSLLATIGRAAAVGRIGQMEASGFLAWWMWWFVHIAYLIGFRNRLGVMLEWGAAMLTGERGVRIITRPIDQDLPKKPSS